MKVSLVVASGVHEGKVIPINAAQFLIGRDPQCQLRPASQAVSKQHCGVLLREDDEVVIKDYGSTNGTVVNDEIVRNEERVIRHNDRVKVGPLDFIVRIEATATHKALSTTPSDSDPMRAKATAALAAVRAVSEAAPATATGETAGRKTPTPRSDDSKIAAKPAAIKPPSAPDHDAIAAMLLGVGDDEDKVPEGSTVMDMPVPELPPPPGESESPKAAKPAAKPMSREDSSNAASEILKKMLRRPR